MIISIDPSLRSIGICCIDENNKLIDCKLIKSRASEKDRPEKHYPILNEEDMLLYNAEEALDFVFEISEKYPIRGICIEGISFAGISPKKDQICANNWMILCFIRRAFPDVLIGKIPVSAWREDVLTKEEKKEGKKKYGRSLYLKQLVVETLPGEVKEKMENYIEKNGFEEHISFGLERSIFDLADAYFLGVYRNNLG